jgi:hypothetical protein
MAAATRRSCASPTCFYQTSDLFCSLWCGMPDALAGARCLCGHDNCARVSSRVLSVSTGPEPRLLDYSRSGARRGSVERSPARWGVSYGLQPDPPDTWATVSRVVMRERDRGHRGTGVLPFQGEPRRFNPKGASR